ncbi:molybdopterin-dependent oxidoreductase, partial [Chloroflexota bacterium]
MQILYHPDRLQYPMRRVGKRGEGKWERISWDEALDYVAEQFRQVASKYGNRSVAWMLGGPGSGTTKFGAYTRLAGCFQGTRVSAFGYGDAAAPCATRVTFGGHRIRNIIGGFDESGLNICWGTNPAEASPFRMRKLFEAKEKGVKLVVIDPVFTITASKADEYLPICIGTDTAMILGMMHQILEDGLEERDFLSRYTVGPLLVRQDNGCYLKAQDLSPDDDRGYVVWDSVSEKPCKPDSAVSPALEGSYNVGGITCKTAFQMLKEVIQEYPPSRAAEICGVPEDQIVRLARAFATSKPVNIYTHNGVGRTYHGDITFRALATLSSLTGNIRLPGPYGYRAVEYNWGPFLKPRLDQPSYSRMSIMNLYDAIDKSKPYPVRAVWFAFINFVNQCVNNNRIVNEIFPKLEFIVVADKFMTTTAQYADVVLPVCTFLEFTSLINGPYPYIQLQQQVVPPLNESKSDVQIVRELAPRLGFGDYFQQDEEGLVDMLLDSDDPSLDGITVHSLKQGPGFLKSPPLPTGYMSSAPARFRTPTGRIEFYTERLLPYGEALPVYKERIESQSSPLAQKYPLSLVQVHSKFHVHSSYLKSSWLHELDPEPHLEMNSADAAARNIEDGSLVEIFNDRGLAKLKTRLSPGIQPGVVNLAHGWWPSDYCEGNLNALTNDAVNPAQDVAYEANMCMNDNLVEARRV